MLFSHGQDLRKGVLSKVGSRDQGRMERCGSKCTTYRIAPSKLSLGGRRRLAPLEVHPPFGAGASWT